MPRAGAGAETLTVCTKVALEDGGMLDAEASQSDDSAVHSGD
jgi:hypothetical protein